MLFRSATLSDVNKELVDCYNQVKADPNEISVLLDKHTKKHSVKYYYRMRKKYNKLDADIEKSALFIYLNKSCFNGIWRVNKKGEFNVPWGRKEKPAIPSKEELIEISKRLRRAKILHRNYQKVLRYAKKDDLIYFDPPYPKINGNGFTKYTKDGFTDQDHEELVGVARALDQKGCYVMISNADIPRIRKFYRDGFYFYDIEVTHFIRADGVRKKVKEVIITNYCVEE